MSEDRQDLGVLWTSKQVATYLHVSPVTVYRWLQTKTVIDHTKVVRFGRHVRIPRSEVERIAGVTRAKIGNDINETNLV